MTIRCPFLSLWTPGESVPPCLWQRGFRNATVALGCHPSVVEPEALHAETFAGSVHCDCGQSVCSGPSRLRNRSARNARGQASADRGGGEVPVGGPKRVDVM